MEPLWNNGYTAIRTIDLTAIVFFERSTYDILSGFNNVPATAHSYHYYNPPQLGKIQDKLANRIKDATRLKTTDMLTEFHFWDEGPPGFIRIVPQIYYPDGIRVFFVPSGSGTYTMDVALRAAAQNGQTIQASVQPFFPTDIIKSPASGKCVDNSISYVIPNNPAFLWTCSSAANQVWKFKNGTISMAFDPNRKSDTYCLDNLGGALASSQMVILNPAILNPTKPDRPRSSRK
ncbi:hypothetical protein BGZ81_005693 [Podila clonocystis]|nr:hypothetical protein BGZ81_005693 [Podila clonocystis]